jgi:hypothetical protein
MEGRAGGYDVKMADTTQANILAERHPERTAVSLWEGRPEVSTDGEG